MKMNNDFEEIFREKNGICRYSDLINCGLNQRQINKLMHNGIIEKVGRGIYNHKNYLVDMLLVYQMDNSKLIYSLETAAYLHSLTDRFPRIYSVTTESGYHLRKTSDLKVNYVKSSLFSLGVVSHKDELGNFVKVYDMERTICDFIKNKDKIEQQVYIEVIQNYFKRKVNLNKLSRYAKQLGITEKVFDIVSLMMKP